MIEQRSVQTMPGTGERWEGSLLGSEGREGQLGHGPPSAAGHTFRQVLSAAEDAASSGSPDGRLGWGDPWPCSGTGWKTPASFAPPSDSGVNRAPKVKWNHYMQTRARREFPLWLGGNEPD